MSVRMGTPRRLLMPDTTLHPPSMPGPLNDFSDVRLALSYDALKMRGTPQREAIVTSDSAIIDACASLSMTHGPAMSARGAPPPRATAPAMTRVVSRIRRCRLLPVVWLLAASCAGGWPR